MAEMLPDWSPGDNPLCPEGSQPSRLLHRPALGKLYLGVVVVQVISIVATRILLKNTPVMTDRVQAGLLW